MGKTQVHKLPFIRDFFIKFRDLNDSFDAYLVLTFVGQTRVLGLDNEDELGEVDINGFDSNDQVK